MPDDNNKTSTTQNPLSTESVVRRQLIGQAIIDGILHPKHAAMLSSGGEYFQNGGNYTQGAGDYHQNGGGNYHQGGAALSTSLISELMKTKTGE